jgi:hypothetical protein
MTYANSNFVILASEEAAGTMTKDFQIGIDPIVPEGWEIDEQVADEEAGILTVTFRKAA